MTENPMGDAANMLAARLKIIQKQRIAGQKKGMAASTRLVLNESNSEVPHEEGDFERGGHASVSDDGRAGAVSYRDTAYKGQSEVLHEDLKMKHDSGRNAKFLERAFARSVDRVRDILGKNIRSEMK